MRKLTNDKESIDDFFANHFMEARAVNQYLRHTHSKMLSQGSMPWCLMTGQAFLRTRLDSISPATPLESLEKSGWKLVYNDQPNWIYREPRHLAKAWEFNRSRLEWLPDADRSFVIGVLYQGTRL